VHLKIPFENDEINKISMTFVGNDSIMV